jgi:transposase-like protein
MNKRRYWLSSAVNQAGTVLELLVQRADREQYAAEGFLYRVLDAEASVEPRVIITDKLASNVPAISNNLSVWWRQSTCQ